MDSFEPAEKSSQPMTDGHRRLLTIMFSDIKDYSKRMQENEAAALEMLAVHNRTMEESVAEFEGNVVKTMGDAFLVTFESALSAAKFAIKVQQRFLEYGKGQPPEKKIEVRIGVHIGDVIVKQNDVFGDGVNIASRIQSMAEPGGVCISKAVYDQVKNKILLPVTRLGVPQLKNIKERVEIYHVVIVPESKLRSAVATRLYILTTILLRKRVKTAIGLSFVLIVAAVTLLLFQRRIEMMDSLAVMPLANLSGDPGQDYFAEAMHEALITDLTKLSGFRRVIARASVMRYRKTDKSPPQIGQELGVDALITGSVLHSGSRVQISVQLINAATEDNLWAERYDRELRDVRSLQNEIVAAITHKIQLQLAPHEQARLASAPSVNPEAYEAYMQGRFHWFKQTREDLDLAERYFQFALEKDPDYALAYAGLASVWMLRADAGFRPPSETFPKASAFVAKALELDEGLAELRVHFANHKTATQWDWSGAEKEFKRAIEINPNLADAHFFYSDLLIALKRPEEWDREVHRALELDPLNDFNKSFYGWHMNYLHRYDEAIAIFQKLLPTGPNKASNYLGLWGAYYRKGMYDDALAAAKEYFTTIGDRKFADALGTGRGEVAYRAGMKRAGEVMVEQSKRRHVPASRIARMFAHARENDSALHWLERAYENRESTLMRLAVFWDWDDLRSDPRFRDLLRRMNLSLGN